MLTHLHSSPTSPSRVLILGAKGFLSKHLQRALAAASIPFRALGSDECNLAEPAEAIPQMSAALHRDDTVVMLSTLTPDRGRDYTTCMKNLRMAESVCAAIENQPCRHFVYLSSDAVYDADKTPLDEDSTREPVDLYALTHTAREMLLGSVLSKREIPYATLRPTTVYGAGDTHNSYGPNRFVRTALREGKIVLFGRGEERRSHLYIDDAIALIQGVILRGSTGTLNLAMQPAVSFRRVAEVVAQQCPKPVKFEFAPRTVQPIHRPYKPTQVFRFITKLGRRIGPVVHRPYAVGAIFEAFPDFRYTPLEEGIERYLRSLQTAVSNEEDQ